MDRQPAIEQLRLIANRLERLSADSTWARRASGLRGSILKLLEEIDAGQVAGSARVEALIERGFEILNKAAHEIPDIKSTGQE